MNELMGLEGFAVASLWAAAGFVSHLNPTTSPLRHRVRSIQERPHPRETAVWHQIACINPKLQSNHRRSFKTFLPSTSNNNNNEAPTKQQGGTARFVGTTDRTTSATSTLDSTLSLLTSDIGNVLLGSLGLLTCVINRVLLMTTSETGIPISEQSRADLLAALASVALLLNGVTKLDVTTALAETVPLAGVNVGATAQIADSSLTKNQQDMVQWTMASVLQATPANTAVLLTNSASSSWKASAVAGIVPNSYTKTVSVGSGPILDRFLRPSQTKETYLPALQALPGKVEFTYLPENTQGALLLPVLHYARVQDNLYNDNDKKEEEESVVVMVLGSDTAKSFAPRDVAWCQVVAAKLGESLQQR